MHTYEAMLEPFEAHTLEAIRTAFQAGWDELSQQVPQADLLLRNRLVGAIANLAQSGIDDPGELKREALQRLRLASVTEEADPDTSGLRLGGSPNPGARSPQGVVQP